jgi:nucleoside-diphosphate-sugar epimerase
MKKVAVEEMKNVIITGATGMVGGISLRLCLENPKIKQITSISRKSTNITHPKLKEILHDDFLNFKSVEKEFRNQDVAIFCLGIYTSQVSTKKLREITVDFTKSFSNTLKDQNEQTSFNFLSGMGTDLTETSMVPFSRFKGEAENHLLRLDFKHLHIFRPGYIYPVSPKQKEPNFWLKWNRDIYPFLKRTLPPNFVRKYSITSEQLAKAMVEIGMNNDTDLKILENLEILNYLDKH